MSSVSDSHIEEDVHIALHRVAKRYGGAAALNDVNVTIRRGEIHALCGENGAGKSTLGKIIAGVATPDEGELIVDGRSVTYHSPRDAIRDGIAMIAQELALVPHLSVLDNVFLGHEFGRHGLLDRASAEDRFNDLAARVGFIGDSSTSAGSLRTAEQQQVEILRALARDARLIVMDEPTAALSRPEADRLHEVARDLRAAGVTIVYVSHVLADVLDLCDTVTVLKDGRLVRTSPLAEETSDSLVTSMLGRTLEHQFPDPREPESDAPVVLEVRGLERPGVFSQIDFDVHAGEIVAIAGLVGAGRTEIVRAIFGADRAEGHVAVDGHELRRRRPASAIAAGMALLPESRKDQGLVMMRSITENVAIVALRDLTMAGVIRRRHERKMVEDVLGSVDVRAASTTLPVSALSGGNQQKVALAKWLVKPPRVLIADEPTRGVDVGAKRAIYDLLHALAAKGVAVLMVSSEIEEVLGLAHRVLVIRRGRIVSEQARCEADAESVMFAAFGADSQFSSTATL